MYSSDDEYQSPAAIRQYAGRVDRAMGNAMKRAKKEKLDESGGKMPSLKRRKVTYSKAESEAGSVSKPVTSLTEFNYAPLHDTLVILFNEISGGTVTVHVTKKTSEEKTSKMKVRLPQAAVVTIGSMLAMKVRKLLETAVLVSNDKTVTIGDKAMAKALQVLGESQALRGLANYDAQISKTALQAHQDLGKDGNKQKVSKENKDKIMNRLKAQKEQEWELAIKSSNPEEKTPVGRAYDIFTPRTLEYLYQETGVRRSSKESVRRILAHYAANFLRNLVARIHPILVNAKRCTVTVSDIENAKDDSTNTNLLGFHSLVKKRVDPKRSKRAQDAANKRKKSNVEPVTTAEGKTVEEGEEEQS